MTISFPLSLPATPRPSRILFRPDDERTTAISESPFTGHQQAVEWDNGLWMAEVTYPPMRRTRAQPLIALLDALRGKRGTLSLGPYLFSSPLGAGGGTPKVKGASQVGYTLITDGWPNSTLVLKAGDMFQIDTQIYRSVSDATTNGSGEVTVDIWPNARNHADNADLDLSSPTCSMRIISKPYPGHEEIPDKWYFVAFSAREVK